LNSGNSKALYRRALARFELGLLDRALEDVELLGGTSTGSSREVRELESRIKERLGPKEAPKSPQKVPGTEYFELSPDKLPNSPKAEEPFPEFSFESSRQGVEEAKEKGSKLFSQGDLAGAQGCFSKALWLLDEGKVPEAESDRKWASTVKAALYSNRAFAYMKQQNWAVTESDCTKSLSFNPEGVKALYRRAMAREELGRRALALEDAEAALRLQPAAEELKSLRDRLRPVAEAKPTSPKIEKPSSPTSEGPASPQNRRRVAPVVGAPSVPSASPKNSFELLRHVNSMKRYPAVLAEYIQERVPPALLQSCFSRSPIEADDLAITLQAIRTGADAMGGALVGDYLRQLLRTRTADTQFSMLSNTEKQVVHHLVAMVPPESAGDLKTQFKKIL